jgi:hypothetical protein
MTAPIDRRRPELELSEAESLRWATRSITESTEQILDPLELLETSLGIEPPRPQLRLVRSSEDRSAPRHVAPDRNHAQRPPAQRHGSFR